MADRGLEPATTSGVTAYGPSTVQLAGKDRIETAVAVSKFGWPTAKTVVIATARQFPDALVGGPLAYMLDAPILLTERASLPPSVAREIRRLGADSVLVLGGSSAVSSTVVDDLVAAGISRKAIIRIGGIDRYDTARLVAEHMGPSDRVTLAVGTNFPDALSVSALAGRLGMPILLTKTKSLPDATEQAIDAIGPTEALVVGGVVAISEAVESQLPNPLRIGGADRFETAALMSEYACRFGLDFNNTFVATGLDFPDALAVGPLSAKMGGSLVLATPTKLPSATERFFLDHCSSIQTIHYVGGTAAVGSGVRSKIATAAETLISDAVVTADAATLSALETITPDGTMVFGSSTAQLTAMNPLTERIILIGEGGYEGAPDGFLREVLAKEPGASGKVLLSTEVVSLEEAIAKGSIDYYEPAEDIEVAHATIDVLSGELVRSAPLSPQLKIGFEETWSLTRSAWIENGGLQGGLSTTGSLTLRGGVYMNVSFRWFTVQTFKTGVYGEERIDLSIEAWTQLEKRIERTLLEKTLKNVTFWIGPVPVYIRFSVEAYYGVEGHGKLALETGFSQVASIDYGTRYRRGEGWRKIDERVFEWGCTPPTVYGSFGASAYAGLRLHARLYGFVGPYVAAEGGLYFDAQMPLYELGVSGSEVAFGNQPDPTSGDTSDGVSTQSLSECSWELGTYSALKGGIELKFPILKVGYEYSIELSRQRLLHYEGPPPPPPGVNPVLESVMSISPTAVRMRFSSYRDALSAVDLSRIRIWDGDSRTAESLPITDYVISGSDVILSTPEQTLDKYWLECGQGAVTDVFARPNSVIQRPFAVARIANVRHVTEDAFSELDISGSGGVSRWVVWASWEEHAESYAWYADLRVHDLESGAGRNLTTDGETSLAVNVSPQVSGNTLVWEKRTHMGEADVWAVDLTGGEPRIVEPGARFPQVDGDWVVYGLSSDLVAERLSTGEKTVVFEDFMWGDSEWVLSDGKVCLLRRDYWSDPATVEVRDLQSGMTRTILSEPQYLSNPRMDGDLVVCIQDGGSSVVTFDLADASPSPRTLPLEGQWWEVIDIWGSNIVCRGWSDSDRVLFVGDIAAEPERWIRLVPPEGYELQTGSLALYGADIACALRHQGDLGLYVLTP